MIVNKNELDWMPMKNFKINDSVIVTPANGHEFMARIVDTAPNGEWIVEDQDSDFFAVSNSELTLNND